MDASEREMIEEWRTLMRCPAFREGLAMPHVVLLGDSIFDNASYVPPGLAVIDQLRASLPAEWTATLPAIDGALVADVHEQIDRLPRDATHLILGDEFADVAAGD